MMESVNRRMAAPSQCRYCSTECKRDITSVYLNRGCEEIYSKMLSETFNVTIYSEPMYEDIFSYLICMDCIRRLRDAVKFKKTVLNGELALKEYLQQVDCKHNNEDEGIIVADKLLGGDDLARVTIKTNNEEETDCENELFYDESPSDISESTMSTYNMRKRKSTPNIKLKDYHVYGAVKKKTKSSNSLRTDRKASKSIVNSHRQSFEGPAVQDMVDDSLWMEVERGPVYEESLTDCEDQSSDQSIEVLIPIKAPVIEELAHEAQKRKTTQNIQLQIPSYPKRTEMKDTFKTIELSTSEKLEVCKNSCDIDDDGQAFESQAVQDTVQHECFMMEAERSPACEEWLTDSEDQSRDQTEDVLIPIKEPVIKELAYKSKKRKTAQNVQLKRTPKKTGIKKSLQTGKKSTKNKLKIGEDGANINDDDESTVPASDASMMNAKTIVEFSTALPFKVAQYNSIGCVYCTEIFYEAEQFRTHLNSAHTNIDKNIAISNPYYNRLTRVDVSNLFCKMCSQTLQSIEAVAIHLKEKHALAINLNESLGLVPINLNKEKFSCVVCGDDFKGLYKLSRHTGSHFALNVCPICGEKTETRTCPCKYLKKNDDIISCNFCKESFANVDAKKLHYEESIMCRVHKCRECGERFITAEERQRHLVEFHGIPQKTFSCTQCKQTFPYRTKLTFHFNTTHSDIYKCQYCNKRFESGVKLQGHVARMHTLEKAYSCELCDISFFEKVQLKRHMRKHDDNKKFHCKVCGQMFIRRYRLTDHIVKYHPDFQPTK